MILRYVAAAGLLLAAATFAAGMRAGFRAGPTRRSAFLLVAAIILALASMATVHSAGVS